MRKLNLYIKTTSPFFDFSQTNKEKVIIFENYIHFVNEKKLYKILSLCKLLSEFNRYKNLTQTKDLTLWFKTKNILKKEIIDAICYPDLSIALDKNTNDPSTFLFQKHLSIINLSNSLKTNFKNIILFNYLKENNREFNDYVFNLLLFFQKNPALFLDQNNSLDFFIKCIFEIDKTKLTKEFQQIENLHINLLFNKYLTKAFVIKKISNFYFSFYQNCLKENILLNFEISYPNNFPIEYFLNKYLQLFEYFTHIKLKEETELLINKISSNKNILVTQSTANPNVKLSNFCFLNENQIFYFNLSAQNINLLNSLLALKNLPNLKTHSFSFIKEKNQINLLNFAKIKR